MTDLSQQATDSSETRATEPVYMVADGELTLDAPVGMAWPRVIDYPSWQDYSSVEHVSGEPGKEGEVVLLRKDEEGFSFPPYYARMIKLEPEHRVIWKTYPLEEQTGTFFGIVDFSVHELGDATRFTYAVLYEFEVPYEDPSELTDFRDQQYENFGALFASVLPKLEQQIDAMAHASEQG